MRRDALSTPLNIAMVSDFFHPNVGGVESHIYMLAVNLMKNGHKVIVITHSHPPDRIGVRWLLPGLKVYNIPFTTIASSATLPNFLTFLPYFRTIILREHITVVHGHASLSSLAHEALLHSHLLGVRSVFTDHSLFALDDAAGILTNKLLEGALRNVDAVICVSHTARENTVLRANLQPETAYVIPNALLPEQFTPSVEPVPSDIVTIVVVSRLAYRKGVDLLVAAAPKICAALPNVRFIIGGDGPKLIELLQMREKYQLQDRIELLGPVRPGEVRDVLVRGHIFLNTSLTESFGIAILEAACAGLYVVSTRVGGVPEVLPPHLVSFAQPDADDVLRAACDAVRLVQRGDHDPWKAHERVRGFYSWKEVTERTESVYRSVEGKPMRGFRERFQRTLELGDFAGPIFIAILAVECLFFLFLEWILPREDVDYVRADWVPERFAELGKRALEEKEDNLKTS